jgi:ubiquinone biosynthesis protein COQ9
MNQENQEAFVSVSSLILKLSDKVDALQEVQTQILIRLSNIEKLNSFENMRLQNRWERISLIVSAIVGGAISFLGGMFIHRL